MTYLHMCRLWSKKISSKIKFYIECLYAKWSSECPEHFCLEDFHLSTPLDHSKFAKVTSKKIKFFSPLSHAILTSNFLSTSQITLKNALKRKHPLGKNFKISILWPWLGIVHDFWHKFDFPTNFYKKTFLSLFLMLNSI